MELVVILLIVGVILFFCRRLDALIYSIAMVDIFLRIITFLKGYIPLEEVSHFIAEYVPSSIFSIINKYFDGALNTIFTWILVSVYIILEGLILRNLFHKKCKK